MASTKGNPANFFQHPAPLGSNLYDRDRVKATPPEGRQLGAGVQHVSSTKAATEPKMAEKASVKGNCAALRCAMLCCVMRSAGALLWCALL